MPVFYRPRRRAVILISDHLVAVFVRIPMSLIKDRAAPSDFECLWREGPARLAPPGRPDPETSVQLIVTPTRHPLTFGQSSNRSYLWPPGETRSARYPLITELPALHPKVVRHSPDCHLHRAPCIPQVADIAPQAGPPAGGASVA